MIYVGSDSVIKVNITTNWWSPSLMLVKDERIMEMTANMALIVLVSKKNEVLGRRWVAKWLAEVQQLSAAFHHMRFTSCMHRMVSVKSP